MTLLIVKITLTPLLIAVATLAARRWGHAVGGWIAGLPLTSGPVSVFLAVEQGAAFAARAACGTLLGLIAVACFCVAYARSAKSSGWVGPTILGLGVYSLVTWSLSRTSFTLLISTFLVLAALGVALMLLPVPVLVAPRVPAPRWDLPMRMSTATAMVLLITASASVLGATWSGLLSPFPVFACVMAIFSHKNGGSGAARRLLRGVILGSFAFASFFVVVALLVQRLNLVAVYTLATALALAVNGFSLVVLLGKHDVG
jgi:hypothetical protein